MATEKWVRYETLVEGDQKQAVIDCLGMPYHFRGDTLRLFAAQILALKTPERSHLLELTALPFRDLVAQASVAFGKVDVSVTEVKKALDRIIGDLAVNKLRRAMAEVISQELEMMYAGMGNGDRIPEQNFCFPITPRRRGPVIRIDLSFIAFKPNTPSAQSACGQTIMFSGLLFTVPSGFGNSRDNMRSCVEIAYKVDGDDLEDLVDIFCGPTAPAEAHDQTKAHDQTEAVADQLGLLRMCSSSGFFSNVDVQEEVSTSSLVPDGTYFLTLPKGTASDVVEQAKSWFTGSVIAKQPNTPFKLNFRQVGDVGSRLEIDVWGPPSLSSQSTDFEPMLVGGLIADAGKALVKHVAAPLIAHHFGKK